MRRFAKFYDKSVNFNAPISQRFIKFRYDLRPKCRATSGKFIIRLFRQSEAMPTLNTSAQRYFTGKLNRRGFPRSINQKGKFDDPFRYRFAEFKSRQKQIIYPNLKCESSLNLDEFYRTYQI